MLGFFFKIHDSARRNSRNLVVAYHKTLFSKQTDGSNASLGMNDPSFFSFFF
jgi:hypothetical protein